MNSQNLLQCVIMFLSALTISLALKEAMATNDDVDAPLSADNIGYIIGKLQRRSGLSLLAPPSVYGSKFAPYLQKTPDKRARYLIWMPAQGYVSVPQEDISNGGGGSPSSSKVFRYG
uniref:IWMPxxGYxxVP n=1 Tax=Mizuhopecten yessoensis TaxID=6573 RepID=A0A346GAX7_MIZYE|nr:IWMPxxGYxxVP [Mizuhopecten yessoensis]